MNLRLSAGLVFLIGVGCQTTVDPIPTHMLRLMCEGAEPKNPIQSRVAILDVGDPLYDFGFATGHGIPSERPCEVKDFAGRTRSVDLIRLADGYQAGEKTDWAIVRFEKISTKHLVRYDLEPIEEFAPFKDQEFSFAEARGLSENAQSCKLAILDFDNGRYRVTHDCRAVPGQSGSPITRVIDGKHKLVGLHIGHLWMFKSPETGRPDRKGYINLLDKNSVKEIESLIAKYRS
ncbi:MAG: hypothetical protein ABJN22_05710 [Litorimonas sp.]